jgi:uncharacterized protein (DUF849 family)
MAHRVGLEVALNGSWDRRRQPRIPVTVAELIEEGLACAQEGAAVIHFHHDAPSGAPADHADAYVRVIEAIRAKRDVIVYPTVGRGERTPDGERSAILARRDAVIEELAARKLLEWSSVDPGSVNITAYAALRVESAGLTYVNSIAEVRAGLALSARLALRPTYAIYEPGFLRLGAALAALLPELQSPLYRLMLSEGMTFGLPPREYALQAYRSLLEEYAPGAAWMVAGYMVDLTPLIPTIVAAGGHLRVGLEDAPLGSERSNAQWVAHAAAAIASAGGELATAAELRSSAPT